MTSGLINVLKTNMIFGVTSGANQPGFVIRNPSLNTTHKFKNLLQKLARFFRTEKKFFKNNPYRSNTS